MWSTKRNRVMEILIIVIVGAIVSILNTLWLRNSLLIGIKNIVNTTKHREQ